MRPETIFINIARGKVVDEQALIAALQNGQIRAAGLDVFEQEPVSADSPLLKMSNVVATPHMGSATHETREAMARCAVDNLLAALAGERPKDLVNPAAWEG
jgi:phosphogluconate 2-dehydrogenase